MALLKSIEEYRNTYINLAEALEHLMEFKESGLFSNCEKRVFWSIFNRLEDHINHPEVLPLTDATYVYILFEDFGGSQGSSVYGIYTSAEAAEAAKAQHEGQWDYYYIEEHLLHS